MKPLSEQLQDLALHVKKMEDSASAARDKDQAELKRRLDQLHSDIKATGQRIETSAANAKEDVRSGWADIKRRIDERLTDARTKLQERKAERDVNKAERRAQAAEDDAADAIAFAIYVLDQAEYAVVDAALARAAADDLRAAA
jgi:DNA repair exonuclease SbcCD ATPase subunit